MSQIKEVQINLIRLNGGTQFRDQVSQEVVKQYKQAMHEDGAFPPIQCVFDGADYWLWDGFHRLSALKSFGLTAVEVEYRNGSLEDAQDLALSANARHGQALNIASKHKKVEAALGMARHANKSDREIAKLCGVSHTMVAVLRRPDRKLARQATMHKAALKIAGNPEFLVSSGVGHHSDAPTVQYDASEDYGPSAEELEAMDRKEQADRAAMYAFLEADDKLAHLEAENKKLRHLTQALELRMNSLMVEKNEAIKDAKAAQAKLDKYFKARK